MNASQGTLSTCNSVVKDSMLWCRGHDHVEPSGLHSSGGEKHKMLDCDNLTGSLRRGSTMTFPPTDAVVAITYSACPLQVSYTANLKSSANLSLPHHYPPTGRFSQQKINNKWKTMASLIV